MPDGLPGFVDSLSLFPIGSNALFLKWTPPRETNGILTGYKIQYQVKNGIEYGPLLERKPHVMDPQATSAILAPLAPNTNYMVLICATTRADQGAMVPPKRQERLNDIPNFTWRTVPVENGHSNVRVTWLPNLDGHPGSNFFVKYKLKGETTFLETMPEFQSTYVEICGFQSGEVYTMSVVAVDGDYMSESAPIEVETKAKK